MILLFGQFVYCGKYYGWTLINVVCLVTWHLLTFYQYMCRNLSVHYHMYWDIHFYLCLFCYLFIMQSNWENTFRKLMGKLILNVTVIYYTCVKHVGLYPSCPRKALIFMRRVCRPNVRMLSTPLHLTLFFRPTIHN